MDERDIEREMTPTPQKICKMKDDGDGLINKNGNHFSVGDDENILIGRRFEIDVSSRDNIIYRGRSYKMCR